MKIITHVVQAMAGGLGWVDCRVATSLDEALTMETALRADDAAWMPGTVDRNTRVVLAAEARCRYAPTPGNYRNPPPRRL